MVHSQYEGKCCSTQKGVGLKNVKKLDKIIVVDTGMRGEAGRGGGGVGGISEAEEELRGEWGSQKGRSAV